jgi:Protein of unknown function (DUF998)
MSTLNRHAAPMRRDGSAPSMARMALLACGIVAALLYVVAHDVLAALLYQGYSPFSQTISELSSIGAPTRAAVTPVVLIHEALLIAFGFGVWQSARGERALRVIGGLLIAYGALGPLWLPFPITARGAIATTGGVNDIMHVILGAVTILLELSIIGFGAAAFGRRFRLYSILTLVTVVVFWGWSFLYAPRLAAGEPTPWLGVIERIALGAWLLWLAMLAVVLIRGDRTSMSGAPESAASVDTTVGSQPSVH